MSLHGRSRSETDGEADLTDGGRVTTLAYLRGNKVEDFSTFAGQSLVQLA